MKADFSFFATRRFLPLFGTQFLGAFNDNMLKTAIVVLISFHGLEMMGMPPQQLVNLAAGIFILPFFLFSASAGKLTERYDKARIARMIKLAEIVIMLVAGAGFLLKSAAILLSALFLMGVHSAFFGPLKYSVLPQYLKEHELVGGTGLIEMGTFLAILLGQLSGSLLTHSGALLIVGALLLVAILGYFSSATMPSVAPGAPHLKLSWNFLGDSVRLIREAWRIHDVRCSILGISWFWLMGAVYTTQLPTFTRLHLGGDADVYTLLLALFSIGIGVGSIACAKLSLGKLQLGIVLLGSAGMTVFGGDLALGAMPSYHGPLAALPAFLAKAGSWRAIIDVTLLGFFGGFFTVPLYTWLQTGSPDAFRSQAVAANNIINGFYMVAAAIGSALMLKWYDSISMLLLAVAALNILATAHLAWRAPVIWRERFSWARALLKRE
ncbi:MFS transporter [Pseudogulbenkiania ferrooxidans]|uniref:Membrane protein n=1 Tax=Pseudogulbenkiania ferrooxidans EGD-HP2 TaxID=1388764 RepID=A0ABP2XIQ4_9NEIS|nr:MFS transporter [Pseudogulbenkiania ferrooxidans]ERE03364.1 membrane protein [Pseudogulbenkiania ferrooxidans EGD-HP2]